MESTFKTDQNPKTLLDTQKLKKQALHHQPLRKNEILVTRKKPNVVYMKRVHELLFKSGENDIIIQGVGAAVQKAIDIALNVQETYCNIELDVHTFTMPIKDLI